MKGADLINTVLPDELLESILRRVESKPDSDSCALVCRKWNLIDRSTRRTIKLNASGAVDRLLTLAVAKFTALTNVYIDERLLCNPSSAFRVSTPSRSRRKSLEGQSSNSARGTLSEENETERLFLSDAGLNSLAIGCKGLLKLSLSWCSSITSLGLVNIADNCRELKSLDIQGCYIGDEALISIGQNCKKLSELNLRSCEAISDKGITSLCENISNSLVLFAIMACPKITDQSLKSLASHCKRLETLNLDSETLKGESIISIAKGCKELKSLNLRCSNVGDVALQAVGNFCANLEVLVLISFQEFTHRSLSAIAKGCKNLRQLVLTDCNLLSLELIARGCTKLETLALNACANIEHAGLEYIGRYCSKLLELSIMCCSRINKNAFKEIGKGCPLLESLNLVDCVSLDDDAMCHIAIGCKNLRKLNIRSCIELGNKGMICVGNNCKRLTDLTLQYCERLTDEPIIAIAEGCSLKHLNVSGCFQITNMGISAVSSNSPDLLTLDISVLEYITDKGIAELAKGCPKLKQLAISHCTNITDVGLTHLAKGCTDLEVCEMVYCPHITSSGIATVVSSCSKIKKVLIEECKVSERTKRRAGSVLSFICVEL